MGSFKKNLMDSKTAQDTGWGVIYRLNDLFREVENLAPAGMYDQWNTKLDRIWSNLCYENPLKFLKDKEGKIVGVEFDAEDIKEKEYLDSLILSARNKMKGIARAIQDKSQLNKNKEYNLSRKKLYDMTMLKEVWLRKKMQQKGLYLKVLKHNPAGSMWGRD